VRLCLERRGFTPQKPPSRATPRSEAPIARWLKQDYPKIARLDQDCCGHAMASTGEPGSPQSLKGCT
jgi:hypothetical protein